MQKQRKRIIATAVRILCKWNIKQKKSGSAYIRRERRGRSSFLVLSHSLALCGKKQKAQKLQSCYAVVAKGSLCLISIVIFSTPISRSSVSASKDDYFICSVHSQRCCSNKRLAVNDSINCTMDSQLSHQNKCQLLQLRAECSIRGDS